MDTIANTVKHLPLPPRSSSLPAAVYNESFLRQLRTAESDINQKKRKMIKSGQDDCDKILANLGKNDQGGGDPTPGEWFKWNAIADEEEVEVPLVRVLTNEAAVVLQRHTPGWSPISNSFIQDEATGEILYTLQRHWSWSSIIATDYCRHQNDHNVDLASQSEHDLSNSSFDSTDSEDSSGKKYTPQQAKHTFSDTTLPYATIQSSSIKLVEAPSLLFTDSKQAKAKIPLNKFCYDEGKTWYGVPNIFKVDGREYILKGPHATDATLSVHRYDSSDNGQPILTLTASTNWQRAGTILIPKHSIFDRVGRRAPDDAVLVNGKPTALLDYALIAEYLYRRRLS